MIKVHLARLLGERKMTMAELARRTGLSEPAIHELYHETRKGIQFATLEKICLALNCHIGDLLEFQSSRSGNFGT